MKVHIKNYERWEDEYLEIDGITALTGPNLLGKSSFIYAISSAIFNCSGTHFIKQGRTFTEVTLEYEFEDKPIKWRWMKSQSASLYINGKPHLKVARRTPQDLLKQGGFIDITIGSSHYFPQFYFQQDSLYGVPPTPPTVLFDLMLSFVEVEGVALSQKDARSDLDKHKSEIKVLHSLEKEVKVRVDRMQVLERKISQDTELRIDEFIEREEALSRLNGALEENKKTSKRLQDIISLMMKIEGFLKKTELARPGLEGLIHFQESFVRVEMFKERIQTIFQLEESVKAVLFKSVELVEYVSLGKALKAHSGIREIFTTLSSDTQACGKELKKVKNELAKIKICPECGAPVFEGRYKYEDKLS